jgi:hypothetical protein
MVMEKCGARSVAELVMIAERIGIMPADGVGPRKEASRATSSR